jgi:hypothetical protein
MLGTIDELYYKERATGILPSALLLGSESYLDFLEEIGNTLFKIIPAGDNISYMGMTVYVVRYNPLLIKVL